MTRDTSAEPLVNLSDIAEIEVFILKRMKEFTLGNHRSVFNGPGFNFVGTREWEPGDPVSAVDWPQSSLTGFSPMITREFEQDGSAPIVAVADASLSTRCGARGAVIAGAVARAVAALGLSGVLFQDLFGLITFDERFRRVAVAPARVGKPHVLYCLDLYQRGLAIDDGGRRDDLIAVLAGHLRRTCLVPVVSDFLGPDAPRLIRELSILNATHDVFLVMVDAQFAYRLTDVSAGWIQTVDVETGSTRLLSRREFGRLAARVAEWQAMIARIARDADLDIVQIGSGRSEMESALAQFVAERRLRKV
jgi:uncharacterized protein (DUF58 family)